MAQDKINTIIDRGAVKKEIKDTSKEIKDFIALIQKVKTTSINITQSKSNQDYTRLRKELEALIKSTNQSADASINAAKAREAEAKANTAEANAIKATTAVKIQATKETERLTKERDKEAAATQKAAQKAKEMSRPYVQLALTYEMVAKEAQDLAAEYGRLDKRAQAAAKRANELGNELKKIDASIGKHQRNVGNYGSAFDKVGGTISGLTTNFLALIGVIGAGSVIKDSVDEFIEMEKNSRRLQNTLKNLGISEAFDRMSRSANKLAKEFGYIDNDEIIKTFDQLIVYGKLTEKQINDLIPVIIDYSAATGKDMKDATTDIIKVLEGSSKPLKEYGINIKDAKTFSEGLSIVMTQLKPKLDGVAESFRDSEGGGLATAKQQFKDLKEEIGTGLLPIINELLRTLLKVPTRLKTFGKAVKESFSGGTGFFAIAHDDIVEQSRFQKETAELIDQRVSAYNSLTKTLTDQKASKDQIASSQTQVTNKLLSDIKKANDDLEHLKKNTRFNNAEDYADIYKALQTIEVNEAALAKINAKISDEVLGGGGGNFSSDDSNAAKEKARREKEAKDAADLAERIRKANYEAAHAVQEDNVKIQEEIFKDEENSFDVRIEALREYVQEKARLIELERQFEKGAKGLVAEEITAIEATKQSDLNQLLRDGHKEYNAILEKQTNEEQEIAKENADRIKQIHEDLAKDIAEGIKAANDKIKEGVEEREQLQADKESLKVQLVEESEALIFDILTAGFERRKNLIQDEIDELERKKQKDIEVANATITNAQDRAAAITIIEARAAAEREILEQRKRQIDLEKARFDKAQSIASIITNTAVAVVKSLDKPALIPLIVAIGAAQLARVIATPIPRYKDGGEVDQDRVIMVGDGGKHEKVNFPDGSSVKTPNVPTLMFAKKGTKIDPDYDKAMAKASVGSVPMFREPIRMDTSTPAILAGLKDIKGAIEKMPQSEINVENLISKSIRGNKILRA